MTDNILALAEDGLFDVARIRETIEESGGFWRSCSGCYEGGEYGGMEQYYPHSEVFGCRVGSGCGECGGIGVVWDSTDYGAMADWMIAQDRTRQNIEAAMREHLRVYPRGPAGWIARLLRRPSGGEIIGLGDAADAILALEQPETHHAK